MRQKVLFLCIILCALVIGTASSSFAAQAVTDGLNKSPAVVSPATIMKSTSLSNQVATSVSTRPMSKWLHMLDKRDGKHQARSSILAFAPEVPSDLARVLKSVSGGGSSPSFTGILFRAIISIVIGFFLGFILKVSMKGPIGRLEKLRPPSGDHLAIILASVLRQIPTIAITLISAIFATSIFLFIDKHATIEGRMVFQVLLGTVLCVKLLSSVGRILFSPDDDSVWFLQMPATLRKPLFRTFVVPTSLILTCYLLANFIKEIGALPQTMSWLLLIFGTGIVGVVAVFVLYLRKEITSILRGKIVDAEASWFTKQWASYWYLAILFYLFVVWFVGMGQEVAGTFVKNGSFAMSMLVIPLYLCLSYISKVIIQSVITSLELNTPVVETVNDELDGEKEGEEIPDSEDIVVLRIHLFFRFIIAGALGTWIMSLWGYSIPFAATAVKSIFESLIILSIALVFWRFFTSYIERKIVEATPVVEIKDGDENEHDDEFGGAVQRGRSHTLLPMVRKVLGTVLIVLVGLTIIASLGINISPLLAGAGVFGLAIGFGAKKLVADIFSGFFFLLDDAFRVGEYIQTGSIKGTVESISLRNVMLRHHLGMLQIVPHSDLGAVTNFMRGGIIVKFPLEFPYDTDIDFVRKVIKKVGIAMLENEDFGDDFIAPIKSQGVNEISNSVMVIRVKFTSKPGKQFVIKREAFRLITEALNKKGIYYAHRKVLVDFPDAETKNNVDDVTKQKALEGAAAATLLAQMEEQRLAEEAAKEGGK